MPKCNSYSLHLREPEILVLQQVVAHWALPWNKGIPAFRRLTVTWSFVFSNIYYFKEYNFHNASIHSSLISYFCHFLSWPSGFLRWECPFLWLNILKVLLSHSFADLSYAQPLQWASIARRINSLRRKERKLNQMSSWFITGYI